MALSEWPDHFKKREDRDDIVTVEFTPEMFVKVITPKAIGLAEDEDGEVDIWIPVSQVSGTIPYRGEWIDSIDVPIWLARDKNLFNE